MWERMLTLMLSICLVIGSLPIMGLAADQKNTETEENSILHGGSLAGHVIGNNKTVQDVIEQSRFTARQGHGFAAERGNNLADRLKGKNAVVVGDDNLKNGPDRKILNRNGSITWIQDKYYAEAEQGIEACFDEKGLFRYLDGDGNPMQIEVPSDQYEQAVALMEEKVKSGKIPGVTDPAEAKTLVRKGSLSYSQARNLAKAGTFESLKYDAVNGIISATCAIGISALLNYAACVVNGAESAEAARIAVMEGLKAGGVVFGTAVICGQLAKTGAVKVFEPGSQALMNALGPRFTQTIVKAYGSGASTVTGANAVRTAAKLMRIQALATGVTVILLSADDIVNLFQGRISSEQFIKNLAVTTAGAAGGAVGWVVGATAGTAVSPGIGTNVGGIAGSIAIGAATGYSTEKVMHLFIEDDAEKMVSIIEETFGQLADAYLINEEEADQITGEIAELLNGKNDKLKEMFQSEDRNAYALEFMEPIFEKQVSKRAYEEPTEGELRKFLLDELKGIVFVH